MQLILNKIGNAKLFCWLLSLTIFSDFLNGLLPNMEIGSVFRIIVLIVCFCAIIRNSKKGCLYIGTIILFLGLNVLLTFFEHSLLSGFIYDIKIAMRVCLYVTIFCTGVCFYKKGELNVSMMKKVVIASMIYAPLLFIITKIMGVGYASYGNNIGFKSFFLSLNSINCALIVLYVFAVYNAFYKRPRLLWITASILVLIPLLMLGTKTSMLLSVAVPVIYTLTFKKTKKYSLVVLVISLLIVLLIYFFDKYIPGMIGETIRRQLYLIKRRDIISYIFSGRNWMLETAFSYYCKTNGFLSYLFGQGYFYSHHNLSIITEYTASFVRPIEMDWADLVLAYGPLSLLFTYGHAGYVLYKTYPKKYSGNVFPFWISILILLLFSMFAGHVFTEAISSTFLAIAAVSAYIGASEESVDTKKDLETLIDICVEDRIQAFTSVGKKMPLIKKLNGDLVLKFVYLLRQSFGRKTESKILFVDEVRNKSMYENLQETINHCPYDYRVINLREKTCKYPHTKIGYLLPIKYLFEILFTHLGIYICTPFAGLKWANKMSTTVLVTVFQKYLKQFHVSAEKIYCMSDHQFYSTVACCDVEFESYVLQHGIIFYQPLYYPILADHFLAWGSNTKSVQYDDPKVIVTGTYKFSKLKPQTNKEKEKSVLYCISIVDNEIVSKKILQMLPVVQKLGYKLKVKMHPGSLFDENELKGLLKNESLEFYKECHLSDISFDLAIIDNSTILLDLLLLDKPFVIFDKKCGYFSIYGDMLPWAQKSKNLEAAFKKAFKDDNMLVREKIMQQELNGGSCTIWE